MPVRILFNINAISLQHFKQQQQQQEIISFQHKGRSSITKAVKEE